jgi:hypothetical protein
MLNTSDLNSWEQGFISNLWEITDEGKGTSRLSAKQVEVLESVHNKHFV